MGEKRARGSVAVVIPCFNDGATLVEAVASAQSQDVPAEIIVVDAGSTDEATMAPSSWKPTGSASSVRRTKARLRHGWQACGRPKRTMSFRSTPTTSSHRAASSG